MSIFSECSVRLTQILKANVFDLNFHEITNTLHLKAVTLFMNCFRSLATALEVIPRTLAQNCGANTIRTLTSLRAKHAETGNAQWGINGLTGKLEDMKNLGIYEPLAVKLQTYKTAVETAILLLRIDDIVSGSKKKDGSDGQQGMPPME